MTKYERAGKAKLWLTIGAFVLAFVALLSAIFAINNQTTTTTFGNSDYSINAIDANGKIVESKQSLVSDMASVEDMIIDIDEETATITYKVAFYDEDGKFISVTESQESDFDATNIPENADTFRVVITPYQVDGENVKLNIFNLGKYTSQLDVSFNK